MMDEQFFKYSASPGLPFLGRRKSSHLRGAADIFPEKMIEARNYIIL